MNTKQKSALCCGSVAALTLLLLQARTKRSFALSLPFSFEIPFTHIGVMDMKIEWSFVTLIVCVVAPVTATGFLLMQDRNEEHKGRRK